MAAARRAAFFDLDKTLIEGSCARPLRARLVQGGHAHAARRSPATSGRTSRFRLRGSTDEETEVLRQSDPRRARRHARQRDLAAARRRSARRDPAARLPADAARGVGPPGRRPAASTSSPPRRRRSPRRSPRVLVFDGGIGMRSEVVDGVYTGTPGGPFTYREGKADAIRELAERRASTSPSPTPTPTPSPTCRCCGPSATRSRSTPTRELAQRRARARAGGSSASTSSARRLKRSRAPRSGPRRLVGGSAGG